LKDYNRRFFSARYTELYVGEQYNITWRLQNYHQGGYRITLVDEKGKPVEQLAPLDGTGYVGVEDQTSARFSFIRRDQGIMPSFQKLVTALSSPLASVLRAVYNTVSQSHLIRVTKPCQHCSILLNRQALEWGSSYSFHTCADVDVLDGHPNSEQKCSGNGNYDDGKCVCKHLYSGDMCQYKDDCSIDADCLNDGKCLEEPTALVHKTCFCAFGFFGRNCDRTFNSRPEADDCFNYNYPVNETKFSKYGLFNEQCFKKATLNDNDSVYSRVVGDEVEIILDYLSTTWVGLGWRPLNIDRSCRLFPDLENIRRKRSPEEIASPSNDEPLQPVPMPKMPKNNGFLNSELQAPLHPMDCTDIVTGAVVEGRSRINDMYTRDRSTPLVDTLLDGEESFSAAYGIEQDGRTIIMFRRRIAEIEPSDHPLGPGKLFVIYAKGQTSDALMHVSKSGNFRDENFYKSDQLRYHGTVNRGVFPIEFVTPEERPPTTRPPLRNRHRGQVETTNAVAEPQPSAEPSPHPKPEPNLQLKAEPEPSLNSEPKPVAEPESHVTGLEMENEDHVDLQHLTEAEHQAHSRPMAEPRQSKNSEPQPEPKLQPNPEPEPNSRPEDESAPSNELGLNSELTHDEHKKARYDPSAYYTSSAMRLVAFSILMLAPLIYML
uniref:EGF-like domain-containing protein n=1 Tax=Ascaris lumbricoides TaxID=6252 RepID=A0A0M3HYW6_ASCLU